MAGRFPPQWLDELRARADIVSVVSQYVTLKQKGRRYWGLCPFHGEKTPSFSVDPEKQMYYCFGCKAGGSVIQFVMDMDRLEFVDAVKQLAEQVHMELPQMTEDPHYRERKNEKERLLSLNRDAALFYHAQLWKKESAYILNYLYGRGLSDSVIRMFGLGATPPGWDGATRYLLSKGYTQDELVTACVSVKKENRIYDMFRERAMFPIINAQGQVLGFGGRALGDVKPKYLNSSDTPVFNKRLGVFAANLLRKERALKRVILVEGYMDVVSLVQQGVRGVVATLGTSLTVEQARLLKRYAPEIWVAYDGDSAGQHAILRALDIFEEEGVPTRVLYFPENLDPDEYIRKYGLAAFEQLAPQDAISYRIARESEQHDLSTQEGRTRYAIACAQILRKVTQPVVLENHVQRLMVETGFSREVLMEQIGAKTPQQAQHAAYVPPKKRLDAQNAREFVPDHIKAEQSILSLLSTGQVDSALVREEDFSVPLHREMAHALLSGASPSAVLESMEDAASREQAAQILGEENHYSREQTMQIVEDCLGRMKRRRIEEDIAARQEAIKQLTGEEKRQAMLEIQSRMLELKRLKAGRKE